MPSGPPSVTAAAASTTATVGGEPQIELIGLRKVFSGHGNQGHGNHGVVAVDGADLTVDDGELFALLGPSGSGKTTVLRMIAGFEQPTAGSIRLGGVDVTDLPARRRDVNTVFQEYALFPHMTVAQNVEYGLKVRGVPKIERRRRTSDALDMVRLTDFAPRRPAQLSGGQRQRVALARALVGRPRVLLLDEPLGALDLKLREQMQIELKAIQREVGITFVIVTHDQDEALTLCDRLAVFNDGRIEQIGKAREVYEHPANRFVADFVGTSNVLDGAAAEAILGRTGTFAIRPERIAVFAPGTDSVSGVRTVDATVAEIIYAGPTTKIAAVASPGVTLTATVLTASTWLPSTLHHGAPITLAWPEKAVHDLNPSSDD
ncbi:ABC transporter ATP-binding protein [Mycobacterium sp. URHB0044]|uniref:ABC transporter ATP-binding protein n=1 Tax=Mycobacterium sp. URHB0044 TaxID=1380386 RepID=UPI00048C8EE7|nr:ABC transporter ATP-binding protein [Mycobacterium sp. URHB0044]